MNPTAPVVPSIPGIPTDAQIPDVAHMLTQAMVDRHWLMAAAGILMVVVFLANKFALPLLAKDPELKSKVLPWVSVALAVVAGVATWILNPSVPPTEIFTAALQIALTAGGSWELFGKSTLGKLIKTSEPMPASPPAPSPVETPAPTPSLAVPESPKAS